MPPIERSVDRPIDRVIRTRRVLAAAIAVRALLWASAVALASGALVTAAARRAGAPDAAVWVVAVVTATIVLLVLLEPWRRLTVARVALWIEERAPELRYALVTAVDPVGATSATASSLERQVAAVSWEGAARRSLARAVAWPLGASVLAAALFLLARRLEPAAKADAASAIVATSKSAPREAAPFTRLVATVRAPAYAGGRTVRIESPASIAALVGSAITLDAPGSASGITARLDSAPLTIQRDGNRWRVELVVGPRPALVRLDHALGDRIVALEPRVDSAPAVRMLAPARDTVLRVAAGAVALAADARDDIGLASGGFEYIVSSGEGESFQFRSGTLGTRQFGGTATGNLTGSLALDRLALKPGDIVHLRAVARDANTVSGPGLGASETRVVRIARAGEYDSVAVEGAPPPEADKSLISQRMLIILTEALEKRRPNLAQATMIAESRTIARDQTRLRKQVGDIIFARLGDDPTGEHGHGPGEEPAPADTAASHPDSARAALLRAASAATGSGEEILDFEGDETPVVAVNRPLLEAYNAMWEASRELDQGETGRALPPMRRALAAIQRARQAERIYLRGKAPAVVVDLTRVRLTGKEIGTGSTRTPRPPTDPAAARRVERLVSAMALAAQSPAAAIDSLVLLRVESLDAAPPLATALGDALVALRNGRDATSQLVRARRVAEGPVRAKAGIGGWSGVW